MSLDDIEQRAIAQTDPALFLQSHPPPIIIDEVQYAPQLFSAIKTAVDKAKRPGMFWLTGSQKFHLMAGITETLAGRVAILDLLGLSQAEIHDRADSVIPFLPTSDWLSHARQFAAGPKGLKEVYHTIWRGAFPKLVLGDDSLRDMFYNGYLQTYIERDVRALARVGDEISFQRFLRASAARTGQLINYADLARDADIDQKTAKAWLSILETSGLVYLLQPYHTNVTNRLVKTPKLYFLDTGLCAYLTQWSTPEALEAGAMSGAILETFMMIELLKSYWHLGKAAYFYFYRDRDQREVDLLIEQDNQLYPVEFKKTASPSLSASKYLPAALYNLDRPIASGAVICLKETEAWLSRQMIAIPVGYM